MSGASELSSRGSYSSSTSVAAFLFLPLPVLLPSAVCPCDSAPLSAASLLLSDPLLSAYGTDGARL